MAMVNQSAARRHHRSRIAYAFGILALFGAATTLVVVVRDPALSSTRLTDPVPAPEITVIGEDPSAEPHDEYDPFAFDEPDPPATEPEPDSGRPVAAAPAGAEPAAAGGHTPEDIRRSLFWSGVLGLAISLAGLGLVGTRRRMW
ncbi:hypothetical protein ACGFJ5_13265 [Micromonospora echinaurantiaca]|uniref:hypothetical protein n=1 Tax=Micromonospora echinaurantiaca TaxID=47857 RepID=UPI0037120B32